MISSLYWILFSILTHQVYACNEALCASVVSKCMLTQSCKCELKNCTCCRECYSCLAHLYTQCCSCVEMCPRTNDTDSGLNEMSHVENFVEPIPALFQVLTVEPDPQLRWVSYTFPVSEELTSFQDIKFTTVTSPEDYTKIVLESDMNCTVAFMSQCMSWNKCKNSCRSMGASSYRWFHDACCECVGANCLKYGISESRCLKCPDDKADESATVAPDYDDYLIGDSLGKSTVHKEGPAGNSAANDMPMDSRTAE